METSPEESRPLDPGALKEKVVAKLETLAVRSSITAGWVFYHVATFPEVMANPFFFLFHARPSPR